MISNEIEIEIGKNALLEPILLDYLNNYLEWDKAISSLGASASWQNTEAVQNLGSFTINNNNSAFFSPNTLGSAPVDLYISYRENNLIKQVFQTLTLRVVGTNKLATISALPDNRLTVVSDGIYVPELQIDLTTEYNNYVNGTSIDTSTDKTSEENLVDFTKTIANEILDLKKETIAVVAGETISALSCVYYKEGVVKILDYTDENNIDFILGIALSTGNIGDKITVKRIGFLQDNFFNFSLGKVWLGAFGSLTQTPPSDGFYLEIGVAVENNKLLLNIQNPIEIGN